MNDRLYRSRDDRVIGGVCAGLADRLDLDPALVRVGWVVLTIMTGGAFLILYIVMLVIVPEEPFGQPAYSQPGPDAIPGWNAPAPGSGWSQASGSRPGEPAPGWTPPASAGAAPGWTPPPSSGSTPPGQPGPVSAEAAAPAGADAPADAATSAGSSPAGGTSPAGSPPPAAGWVPPSTGATWTDARAERRAARRAAKAERRGYGDPTAGLIFGGILVLLGIYFLAQQYIPELDLGRFWPVLVIAVGVVLVGRALYRPGSDR